MRKLKEWAWLAAIAFGLTTAYFWWSAGVAEADYLKFKAESEQEIARLESSLLDLRADTAAAKAQNDVLFQRVNSLEADNRRLRDDMSRLRERAEREAAEVPSLPLNAVAQRTLQYLELTPPEIRITADDYLVFTRLAADTNLQHLIWGNSAQERLAIAEQRITTLETEVQTQAAIIGNKDRIITNKDAEIENLGEQHSLALAVKDKEIAAVKAKARKRNVVVGIFSFIGGIVVKAVLF